MRLFLCEKPSQGKDIGRILGATQRGEGCLNGSGVTVTWCIGHLVEAAAPEVYDAALKRWSLEQFPIIPKRWRVEAKPKTATQFKVVKALLAKATQLVIATDADREGELIAREIIDLCGYRGPIERLWLSALNDASIRTALAKLRPSAETLPMYYSALARSRADWLVGLNLSRPFTLLESVSAEVPPVRDSLPKPAPTLAQIMGQLDRTQRSRAWNDGKVTAHHGIIPTLEPANLSAMSEKERALYRLIRAHYLAQFLPHHEFDRTVADLSCGQQKLVATGKQVVARGWRLVLAESEREGSADED